MMKKIITGIVLSILLILMLFVFTGCKLVFETSDNSVSASVDENTTNTMEGIVDWTTNRIDRVIE